MITLLTDSALADKQATADSPPVRPGPNVIVILGDDLGYGDLGCFGSERIKTQNIDRMAAEGMKFTDFYATAPICMKTQETKMNRVKGITMKLIPLKIVIPITMCFFAGSGICNANPDAENPKPGFKRSINFKSIKEALSQPMGAHFWVARDGGKYSTGHTESFYVKNENRENLTFDISNNEVHLNTLYNGTLKEFVVSRSTYFSDFFPGGHIQADFTRSAPLSFGLTIGKSQYDLDKVDWNFKTGFLGGFFPLTEYTHEGMNLKVLTFAPISSDGNIRPRVGIYGLLLENRTQKPLAGKISIPYTCEDMNGRPSKSKAMWSRRNTIVLVADGVADPYAGEVSFELKAGDHIWVPCVISPYGNDKDYDLINSKGTQHWLNEAWAFFDKMTGHIEMKDDPLTAELIQRSIVLNFNGPVLDAFGALAATTFGGAYTRTPFAGGNNIANMYYPFVPLSLFDPELVKRAIPWFLKYGVRPKGPIFAGGISHSLGNSVASAMLAGLYYQHTGDKSFFLDNKEFKSQFTDLLDAVLKTRKDKDVFLFPSLYISDGYSLGDYHTGSNISAWYAFKSISRILREVYNDAEKADYYLDISQKIKEGVDKFCVVDGPFGRQFNEGGNKQGTEQLPLVHDGEESAINLSPLYGYLSYDDPRYLNHNRFAVTAHNPCYSPETRGIYWEKYPKGVPKGLKTSGGYCADATLPAYITALASCTDKETLSGSDGHLTEIKKLTDLNGVCWWWPYKVGAKRGDVQRECAPCDFVMASFLTVMVSEYLGVKYDAPTQTLCFRPFLVSKDFSWKGLRMGSGTFDLIYRIKDGQIEAYVKNNNPYSISVQIELIPEEGCKLHKYSLNGREGSPSKGSFLKRETAIFQLEVPAQGEVTAHALMKAL